MDRFDRAQKLPPSTGYLIEGWSWRAARRTPVRGTSLTIDVDDDASLPADTRRVVAFLLAKQSDDYIAIMEVFEASITDLTPPDVAGALGAKGRHLDLSTVEERLKKLWKWGAVSTRVDTSKLQRKEELFHSNWRYSATVSGRHAYRFYRDYLAGGAVVREIPLTSLARVVEEAERLAAGKVTDISGSVRQLFVSHDDLDAALVGAEDGLAALADHFDLDDGQTAELKALLVSYATHVASELDRGAARAFRAISALRPRFAEFSQHAVNASDARALIERGALKAARGGRAVDWEDLLAWLHPASGRAYRFAMRMVRALPSMHLNLRRLHSSSGSATNRSKALLLARACRNETYGTQLMLAALGDHPWRKLFAEASEPEGSRLVAWREGPTVTIPDLLRLLGRSGGGGRAAAPRDDAAAKADVAERRKLRMERHAASIREVLHAGPEGPLSSAAAFVAFASLLVAAKARASGGRRTGVKDGLACTLVERAGSCAVLRAPDWQVRLPNRALAFHLPREKPNLPESTTTIDEAAEAAQ